MVVDVGRALHKGDRLVVASHNLHKIRELEDFLRPFAMSVAAAPALGLDEPEETGATFEENAEIKARAAAAASQLPALADDSGLAVDALDGAPGVYSARWAGADKDFAAAMRAVEERLESAGATTPDKRRARFVAVICLAFPDGGHQTFRGEVAGTLVWPPRGDNGFGYDPVFVPEGHDRTFGEMTADEKNGLSHRWRALDAFARARLGAP
jgi:XTP/dITP diphosphohydrolase